MTDFTINNFKGSVPRLAEHLLQTGVANIARDCKLQSGRLDSFREPLLSRVPVEDTLTTYLHDCCWLDFDKCVDIAVGPVTCHKIFVTGLRDYPVELSTSGEDCVVSERRLGLPCPERVPSVMPGANTSHRKDIEGRSWAYQFVNSNGDKSSLSPGSRAQNLHDGQSAVISNWEVPEAEWSIVSVNIYRTVTGHQSGREPVNVADTTWMLVGTAGINDASFTDTLYNDELLTALEEDIATPPPANLRGITWIESMNTLAGFVGNRIYFSENNKYDHWPHYLDLDDNVCAIVESNQLIFVATDGRPYAIEGVVGCENAGCRKAVRLPGNYPMIGCGSRRMAAVTSGAVYPSQAGLVWLTGTAPAKVMTWPYYSEDEWHALMPESATPVEKGGKLYVFAKGGSFVMNMFTNHEDGWDNDQHSELSDTDVLDAFVTRQGDLYLLKADGVYLWDRGQDLRPHYWQSSEFVTPVPIGLGAGHLHFQHGPESVKIEVDGRTALDREVISARVFRLPMWADGTRWTVTLSGTGLVSLVSIAPSMLDLGR